jgi:hypothetical protein
MIRARAKLWDDCCHLCCGGDVPARGEQVDVSRYVAGTARLLELKVTLKPANGTVVVYSPGYEAQQVEFSQELSFGWIPFAEPVLCIRSIGGPFEFNIDISPIEDAD